MAENLFDKEKEDPGFELDKIDLSSLVKRLPHEVPEITPEQPSTNGTQGVSDETSLYQPSDTPTEIPELPFSMPVYSGKGPKKLIKRASFGVIALIAVSAAIFLLSGLQEDHPKAAPKRITSPKPETYISIGPIISALKSGEKIKITLDINCVTKEDRQNIRALDNEIRNRVIWATQTTEADNLLKTGDYTSLREFISKQIFAILPSHTVTEIYFSEFLRF
jgi:flagellar basal body-associated protein FliL